jgi:predicted nucleic acid-binding protein
MANQVVLVDTSILIDYYRKSDKSKSIWVNLVRQGHTFAVSAITKYEIYSGATENQLAFWNNVFRSMTILPFDEACVDSAVLINAVLKRKRKQIGIADLFIAATAMSHQLPVATLNRKHFERVDDLRILNE